MKYTILTLALFTLFLACVPENKEAVKNPEKKIDSIISLMTIEEKIGQMTQVDQQFLDDTQDISNYAIGSLLSGGGSKPDTNSFEAWANMYDKYQKIAMTSRLGIPLIYGIDAVHAVSYTHLTLPTIYSV